MFSSAILSRTATRLPNAFAASKSSTTKFSTTAFRGAGLRSNGVVASNFGKTTTSNVLPKRIMTNHKNGFGNRVMSTTAPKDPGYSTTTKVIGGTVVTVLTLQALFGSKKDYFEYRFITTADPDDLASFYGGEEFMELYCIFPIVGAIMMRGGYFDDEGTVHTMGVPGELLVSMVFSDQADEETGETLWFNKRERFQDVCMGFTMWDQVTNFGFHTLPDGRVEVYHHGEYFTGYLPGVALAMKTAFQFQAYWVAYATEYHLNYIAFRAETEEEEEKEELSRKNFWWYMLKYEVFGSMKEKMGMGKTERTKTLKSEHIFDDEVDTSQEINIKRSATMAQIKQDMEMDKSAGKYDDDDDDIDEIPDPSKGMNVYRRATLAAMKKHKTLRVAKRKTTKTSV